MKIKNDLKGTFNGVEYIRGKRVCKETITADKYTFEQAIKEIDRTFNKYGLLSKIDRIKGMMKHGFDTEKCKAKIREYLQTVPVEWRQMIYDIYTR